MAKKYNLVEQVRQSPPLLDFPGTVDDSWLENKTVVITGGASGFGEGFVRRWAAAKACIVFGDINSERGSKLCIEVREATRNENVHFVHCDVTSWSSQVHLFHESIKLSPHGGVDAVVANAGIADTKLEFENPKDLDAAGPPPPNLDCLTVNLTGVLYTTHLAIYYLSRNPGSSPASPRCRPSQLLRDRHILLIGSVASFIPLPGQALYGASKHAVLGLYRCLRSSAFVHGIRCSLICPYFIDTPLLRPRGKLLLAGGSVGEPESVVEAATRFASDPRIVGRAVFVGPKLRVKTSSDGEWILDSGSGGEEKAIWEFFAGDFEDSEIFQRNMVGLMNRATEERGWLGWAADIGGVLVTAAKSYWKS